MSNSSIIFARGVVAQRYGNDGEAHESIEYKFLLLEPRAVAGQEFDHVKPRRGFEAEMDIHPADVGDEVRAVLDGTDIKFFVNEWEAFAPCEDAPPPGFLSTAVERIRRVFGGPSTPLSGTPSEGVGE